MVLVYKRRRLGDSSSLKMIEWFNKNNIVYNEIYPSQLTANIIRQMLHVSELGFESIITTKCVKVLEEKDKISTEKLIELILEKPTYYLKNPIAFNEKSLIAGYNADEIRIFIPRSRRLREYYDEKKL